MGFQSHIEGFDSLDSLVNVLWCNGNTIGLGPIDLSSILGRTTMLDFIKLLFWIFSEKTDNINLILSNELEEVNKK